MKFILAKLFFRCVGGVHFIMFGSGFSAFAVNNLRKEKS